MRLELFDRSDSIDSVRTHHISTFLVVVGCHDKDVFAYHNMAESYKNMEDDWKRLFALFDEIIDSTDHGLSDAVVYALRASRGW